MKKKSRHYFEAIDEFEKVIPSKFINQQLTMETCCNCGSDQGVALFCYAECDIDATPRHEQLKAVLPTEKYVSVSNHDCTRVVAPICWRCLTIKRKTHAAMQQSCEYPPLTRGYIEVNGISMSGYVLKECRECSQEVFHVGIHRTPEDGVCHNCRAAKSRQEKWIEARKAKTRHCGYCECEFPPHRITAKYCSDKCRVYANRKAQKAGLAEALQRVHSLIKAMASK